MGVVAVAGGTGHMGRSIVDALVASKKHKTVILSRKVGNPFIIFLHLQYLTIRSLIQIWKGSLEFQSLLSTMTTSRRSLRPLSKIMLTLSYLPS